MSSKDAETMLKDYADKARASRTGFQKFVDAFTFIPITIYFIISVILNYPAGIQLAGAEFGLKFLFNGVVLPWAFDLTTYQTAALLNALLFVNPVPATWYAGLYTAAAISMVVSGAFFIFYFISRAVAYREVYDLDVGLLVFFVSGIVIMFLSHTIGISTTITRVSWYTPFWQFQP